MQDIHDFGERGVTFFPGDRRMRANQNNILNQHQSLKCPRCNSLNTKFCYYNNYNLSQPRHFCKNCRRYWTKGGVLRNVPVGGGCRKTKRSKSKSSSADKTIKSQNHVVEEKSSTGSHSSSDSSSLTAATVSVSAAATPVEVTDMPNLKLYGNGIEWSTLLGQGLSDGVFSEIETTPFGFGGSLVNERDHLKLEGETQFEDRTVEVEFLGRSLDPNMGFEPLDWGSGGGDLTSSVDHAYWSQSQWTLTEEDQNGFYLP